MQGKKEFDHKLFCDIDLMEVIGEDHILVRLNDALDLGWIREVTRGYYSHTGRPSVDPVALVKMMLIGYLYGIPSERRLAEEVRLNIAYRWFAGYNLDEQPPNEVRGCGFEPLHPLHAITKTTCQSLDLKRLDSPAL